MFNQEPLHHFDDWDDFESSHPEITVVRENEIIIQIEFPLEAEGVTCIIVNGEVYFYNIICRPPMNLILLDQRKPARAYYMT